MSGPRRTPLGLPPDSELQWSFARSSGSGGQNVNKVSTKAVLRWAVIRSAWLPADVRARFLQRFAPRITMDGDLVIASDRWREQPRNIEECKARLGQMIAEVETPPVPRRPTRPTRASRERRLEGKRANAQRKRDRSSGGDD